MLQRTALDDLRHVEPAAPHVRHLRQVLLWPLRLVVNAEDAGELDRRPWLALHKLGDNSPWREHHDEYTGDADHFHERHYNEFVTFLPYVQRFLYGEGRSERGARGDAKGDAGLGQTNAGNAWRCESPMRVFRRHDVAAARVVVQPGDAPVTLEVVHVDLYFFTGVEVVLFNLELAADDLPLPQAQELMYRLGRAYPAGWDATGEPLHCLHQVQWLDAQGAVLAESDSREREAFLRHVAEKRSPRIAAHWQFMLAPLVWHPGDGASDGAAALRVRQIEYYRMPMMAWLALDDPRALSRKDFVRLGLVTGSSGSAGSGAARELRELRELREVSPLTADTDLPYAEQHLARFEERHCYDRFWSGAGAAPNTRYLCTGLSLVVVGQANSEFYRCRDRGVLAQFRHQHFLLFLIAHFQKATLLMYSDRLAEALVDLDLRRPQTIKRFKRQIRLAYVNFLTFTHGYWFHEVSEQAHVKALFAMCREHLGSDALYREVKERIHDMNGYLDADALRRQANTVVRLTVVTIFGLIGTVTTGFLGMNLLAEADAPLALRVLIFGVVFVATISLTMYTITKSKRLSDFLDVVSDERLSTWTKVRAFFAVWRRGGGDEN